MRVNHAKAERASTIPAQHPVPTPTSYSVPAPKNATTRVTSEDTESEEAEHRRDVLRWEGEGGYPGIVTDE